MSRSAGVGILCFVTVLSSVSGVAAVIDVPNDQPSISAAISVASLGDVIFVSEDWVFGVEPLIDYQGKAITIESMYSIQQPQDGLYLLAPDSELFAADAGLHLDGELRSSTVGTATVIGQTINVNNGGRVVVQPGARLDLRATNYQYIDGVVQVGAGAVLELHTSNGSVGVSQYSGTIALAAGARLEVAADEFGCDGALSAIDATVNIARDLYQSEWTFYMQGGNLSVGRDLTTNSTGLMTLWDTDLVVGRDLLNRGTLRVFHALLSAYEVRNGQYNNDACHLTLDDVTISTTVLQNHDDAELFAAGAWWADVINQGHLYVTDDLEITGATLNDPQGTIVIQNGVLTLYGTLDNQGQIIGDYGVAADGGRTAPAMVIHGDLTIGNVGGLAFPDSHLRVDGDLASALQDQSLFDMRAATLTVAPLAGSLVNVEVMSTDVGANPGGLDPQWPGHFPIGTLRVGSGTAVLTDASDNDGAGQTAPEALYVETLEIMNGGTLDPGDAVVYYDTLSNAGTITDPTRVVQLSAMMVGDLNCDGVVTAADIDPFVLALTGGRNAYEHSYPACEFDRADCNYDGSVSPADIDSFVQILIR
jgi:hypothetical protein